MILNQLYKAFGLKKEEIFLAFLMQVYLLIIITVLLMVKPTVNALFLNHLGSEQLPIAFILVAIFAIVITRFYNILNRKMSLIMVNIITIVFFASGFLLFALTDDVSTSTPAILYGAYVAIALFAVMMTSQFWILANLVYNPREAKRVFGFIGAGGILGGIIGGYLTTIIATTQSSSTVILYAAGLLILCIPIGGIIWRKAFPDKMRARATRYKSVPRQNTKSALSLILKSKHLSFIALVMGLGVVVAKLVDFQFSDFASKAFSNPESLSAFFGFWFSTFNIIALIVQLLLSNRIIDRFGVNSTLLLLPIGIALSSMMFFIIPELWVLVLIKGIDGSLKQSLNKAAMELAIVPVPLETKKRTKAFIDVVVDSVATGFAGFMIIFLIRYLELNSIQISVIVILLVVLWLVGIYFLREAYYNSFLSNIERTIKNVKESKGLFSKRKEATITKSKKILREGDSSQIVQLLTTINGYLVKALQPEVLELLDHENDKVKVAALKSLKSFGDKSISNKVGALLNSDNEKVLYASMKFLLKHSLASNNSIYLKYLDHPNPALNNAALLNLVEESIVRPDIIDDYDVINRLQTKIDNIKNIPEDDQSDYLGQILLIIGSGNLKNFYTYLEEQLDSTNIEIRKFAIRAAGISQEPRLVTKLLNTLIDKDLFGETKEALFSYGPDIVKYILATESEGNLTKKVTKHLPEILKGFQSQEAVNFLIRLNKGKDILFRFDACKALSAIRDKAEYLHFDKKTIRKMVYKESNRFEDTMIYFHSIQQKIAEESTSLHQNAESIKYARQNLQNLLSNHIDLHIRIIFILLSFLYDKSKLTLTYSGLASDNSEARFNALEVLDNLLYHKLKTVLLPQIEYYIRYKNIEIDAYTGKTISEINYVEELLLRRSKAVKMEVLHLIKELGTQDFLQMTTALSSNPDEELQKMAIQALRAITDTKSTLENN